MAIGSGVGTPVPESGALPEIEFGVSVSVKLPENVAAVPGANSTVTVHVALAASVEPQVVESFENEVPLTAVETLSVAVPVF